MDSFIDGLFGNATVNDTEVVPISNDTLLRVRTIFNLNYQSLKEFPIRLYEVIPHFQLYKICKSWMDQVSVSPGKNEVDELLNGSLFSVMIDNVSQRLGFSDKLSFGIYTFRINVSFVRWLWAKIVLIITWFRRCSNYVYCLFFRKCLVHR